MVGPQRPKKALRGKGGSKRGRALKAVVARLGKKGVKEGAKEGVKKKKFIGEKALDKLLQQIYYDPQQPGSLGGVDKLFRAVRGEGVGKERVAAWLRGQPSYSRHKPYLRHYSRQRVIVNGKDQQWQADLVDMQKWKSHNDGYKYILTVIDVLSKYGWAVPLKDKTGPQIVQAFTIIFKGGRVPEKLQTDDGTEFKNRTFQAFLAERKIHFFTTRSEMKASIVERFNRTLKTWMWRWFTEANTFRYVDMLPKLVENYNHSYHRSIKRAPADVVTPDDAQEVWHTLYGGEASSKKKGKSRPPPKFHVGDKVRVSKVKNVFAKGYTPNWTEEVFTIAQQYHDKKQDTYAYRVREYDGTWIEGRFYEPELQLVRFDEEKELYRIEKVLKTRGVGRKKEHFVKWRGWPAKYNSWVPAREVHKIG
ncbi:uncharacterized protein LOC116604600 [Nematostella vectensis]|uniref:uncharacterized protein LOC116604600 n=1 Tax=Nematostella vectensis TaxID=45351 RepID=UPI0020773E61|nr:uncharacterized protein LOC116604600 [Nematostella vectensis]